MLLFPIETFQATIDHASDGGRAVGSRVYSVSDNPLKTLILQMFRLRA